MQIGWMISIERPQPSCHKSNSTSHWRSVSVERGCCRLLVSAVTLTFLSKAGCSSMELCLGASTVYQNRRTRRGSCPWTSCPPSCSCHPEPLGPMETPHRTKSPSPWVLGFGACPHRLDMEGLESFTHSLRNIPGAISPSCTYCWSRAGEYFLSLSSIPFHWLFGLPSCSAQWELSYDLLFFQIFSWGTYSNHWTLTSAHFPSKISVHLVGTNDYRV